MDAVKFLQERARMCNSFSPDCEGCRVDEEKPVISECYRWMLENPERAVKIVEEWSAAHPVKTRQDVFLEQWPEAKIENGGCLGACPYFVSAIHRDKYGRCAVHGKSCYECRQEFWTQVVE